MEKFGFVYLWRDRKYNRYYIGSHWGREDDGYICSSNAMRDAYRRRPEDFKRHILKRIYTNRSDLLKEEQRWLDMLRPSQFGYQYYNINARATDYAWWMNEETKQQVSEKLKGNQNAKGIAFTKERCKKISKKLMGNTNGAHPMSDETRQKLQKNNWSNPRTETQIKATKKNQKKGAEASPITKKSWIPTHRIGTKHTPKTLEKMRQARLKYYEEKRANA